VSTVQRLANRKDGPLTPTRAARRMSAYIYGNILVLAAVVGASTAALQNGSAVLLVVGTTVSTYLAHVYSEIVGHSLVSSESDSREFPHELRDAVPIISAGTVPIIALLLGYLQVLPSDWAWAIAGAIIVVRIASIGFWTERLRGNPPSFRSLTVGIAAAAICAVIVLIKVLVAH
jgi:hypothetical protein